MITTSRRIMVTRQPIRIDVLPSSGGPGFDGLAVVWSSVKHRWAIKVQSKCVTHVSSFKSNPFDFHNVTHFVHLYSPETDWIRKSSLGFWLDKHFIFFGIACIKKVYSIKWFHVACKNAGFSQHSDSLPVFCVVCGCLLLTSYEGGVNNGGLRVGSTLVAAMENN